MPRASGDMSAGSVPLAGVLWTGSALAPDLGDECATLLPDCR